ILVKLLQRAQDAQFSFTAQFADQFGVNLTDVSGELVFTLGPDGGILYVARSLSPVCPPRRGRLLRWEQHARGSGAAAAWRRPRAHDASSARASAASAPPRLTAPRTVSRVRDDR